MLSNNLSLSLSLQIFLSIKSENHNEKIQFLNSKEKQFEYYKQMD